MKRARPGTYNDLPVDVALPPRVGACEFADWAVYFFFY
jgi:hypothetical protein